MDQTIVPCKVAVSVLLTLFSYFSRGGDWEVFYVIQTGSIEKIDKTCLKEKFVLKIIEE